MMNVKNDEMSVKLLQIGKNRIRRRSKLCACVVRDWRPNELIWAMVYVIPSIAYSHLQ